jgi:hypothetical protein
MNLEQRKRKRQTKSILECCQKTQRYHSEYDAKTGELLSVKPYLQVCSLTGRYQFLDGKIYCHVHARNRAFSELCKKREIINLIKKMKMEGKTIFFKSGPKPDPGLEKVKKN